MNRNGINHGGMSLAAASKFLNIREHVLEKLAEQKRVPARRVGKQWRFSRTRLDEWMRGGIEPEIALLRLAGVHKDDPDLMPMLAEIYKARGRPECEEE